MRRTGFVHQALCYGPDDEFLEGTLTFAATGWTPVTTSSPSRPATSPSSTRHSATTRARCSSWMPTTCTAAPSDLATLGRDNACCAAYDTDGAGRPRRVRIRR